MQKDELTALEALLAKMTPGEWYHYDEVFRPQFGRRRITEIQRHDGKPIVSWTGFDGLPAVTERKRNANAAGIVALVNAAPALLASAARAAELEAEVARLRGLLKPFARIAEMERDAGPCASVMVNVARCRDAAAALGEQQ